MGSLRDQEVACSASNRQGSNFESCVWRTPHNPQEVLLAQFSLYVHKGGLKSHSFHLCFIHSVMDGDIVVLCSCDVKKIGFALGKMHKKCLFAVLRLLKFTTSCKKCNFTAQRFCKIFVSTYRFSCENVHIRIKLKTFVETVHSCAPRM